MASEWFESLKSGEPDAPLEIVVRFKEELYYHAFGLLKQRLDTPQIAADEIAMSTLEHACLHCQRGGFANLNHERELVDWLHDAAETSIEDYFAALDRRRALLKAFADSRADDVIARANVSASELADFVDGFPLSFRDPETQEVAKLFLELNDVGTIQDELNLSGPSVRRRFDTVEKAFDRAVFSEKHEILSIELPDDVVLAIVDWFEEELARGMVYEHEFRQLFRECCKANYRIGKEHKHQFMFYMADVLRTYESEANDLPQSDASDLKSIDSASVIRSTEAKRSDRSLQAPTWITSVIMLIALIGILAYFSNATAVWINSSTSLSDSESSVETPADLPEKTTVLETHSVRAVVTFRRLQLNRVLADEPPQSGPTARLAGGMYFVSVVYPDRSVIEVLRTVPLGDESDLSQAPDGNDSTYAHRGYQDSTRFIFLPEIRLRRVRTFEGPLRQDGRGSLSEPISNKLLQPNSAVGDAGDTPATTTWDEAVAFAESYGMRIPWKAELAAAGYTPAAQTGFWTIDAEGPLDEQRKILLFKPALAPESPGK